MCWVHRRLLLLARPGAGDARGAAPGGGHGGRERGPDVGLRGCLRRRQGVGPGPRRLAPRHRRLCQHQVRLSGRPRLISARLPLFDFLASIYLNQHFVERFIIIWFDLDDFYAGEFSDVTDFIRVKLILENCLSSLHYKSMYFYLTVLKLWVYTENKLSVIPLAPIVMRNILHSILKKRAKILKYSARSIVIAVCNLSKWRFPGKMTCKISNWLMNFSSNLLRTWISEMMKFIQRKPAISFWRFTSRKGSFSSGFGYSFARSQHRIVGTAFTPWTRAETRSHQRHGVIWIIGTFINENCLLLTNWTCFCFDENHKFGRYYGTVLRLRISKKPSIRYSVHFDLAQIIYINVLSTIWKARKNSTF